MSKRKANGTYAKGVSGNPKGRPTARTERRYLDILISSCTEDDWAEIAEVAVEDAKDGDMHARKWLSDRIMGPVANRNVNMNVPMEMLSDAQLERIANGEDAILVIATTGS